MQVALIVELTQILNHMCIKFCFVYLTVHHPSPLTHTGRDYNERIAARAPENNFSTLGRVRPAKGVVLVAAFAVHTLTHFSTGSI